MRNASSCITDEKLAELLDRRLSPADLNRLHEHAAECTDCRALLVAVAKGGGRPDPRAEEASDASTEPSALADGWVPPTQFDEFKLIRLLGRGAMGVVYLAHDQTLERQVAVKFIATPRPDARVREHFQREARAIARLQHPNVLTVFRVGECQGHPYIVSEYLEGKSLAELARPLPWRRALGLGVGLARGLAAAHQQGVLHRDLKPSNVLLTTAGEVKLLDFGLAELVETKAPSEGSNARLLVGTPLYMAPELFRGQPATQQSDLFALGMILYELCTGTPPQRRRDQATGTPGEREALARGGAGLMERVSGMDPEFAAIIERSLRADPEERFATAEALREALERIEGPEELAAGNPYRGLAPFEAEHRGDFFGRDADIRAVLERLRRPQWVLVAGDSGVGKSSLCRAGVLPRVVQGALDEIRDFRTLTLEPGRRPLEALAAALAPVMGVTEAALRSRLAEAPGEVAQALRAAHQKGRGLLLFVDQLEELLTLSDLVQAEHFARALGELALSAEDVRVLLAVRGDFLTRLGALPGLGAEVERALYLLRPLAPEGVREAIVGPARSRGLVFESESLIQTLREATAKGAGSLPLLQFALAELWERRDAARSRITRAALEEMGGVAGALSRHADSVLARLSAREQQAARHLLGRLITAEGTRGERSEEELSGASEEARAALRALVRGRLVHARNTGDRASYEIAHEALLTNWSTLRQWLDEDTGQRALRQRLEKAVEEWERLDRSQEFLWRKRQLDEARALDTAALGKGEQEFLSASRRAVRRQTRFRWGAALLFVLTAAGLYWGPRLQAYLDTQKFVSERLTNAEPVLARARELRERASASRTQALKFFAPGAFCAGETKNRDLRDCQEEEWTQTLELFEAAEAASDEAAGLLEDVLERIPRHPEAHQRLINLTYERIELAERFFRRAERDRLIQRFHRLTTQEPALRRLLEAPAILDLTTDPPGANVEFARYVEDANGLLRQEPVTNLSVRQTPLTQLTLPSGSYHLKITHENRAPVDLPLLLERGGPTQVSLALPTRVPKGYRYIPPGCFLTGSADPEEMRRDSQESAPMHEICLLEGYLIGEYEVTLGDWLTYLDTLPESSPKHGMLAEPDFDINRRALTVRKLSNGQWNFALYLANGDVLEAPAGKPIRYPGRRLRTEQNWLRFPLTRVAYVDIKEYLGWLDRTGRLPGARLCSELEWTRAARGADGRRFPHGNRLKRDEANIDATYGREPSAYGPDEVGTHVASVSPFGVYDLVGNVFEITHPVTPELGEIILKGGSWYYGAKDAAIPSRHAGTTTHRDINAGVRVCAPYAIQ